MNPDPNAIVDLASVANFALTCRAFTEPALDRLWYELPGLCPLLQLFPEDCWELQRAELLIEARRPSRNSAFGPTFVFRFTRALQLNDWIRLNAYAQRVRSLMHVETDLTEISVAISVLRHLSLQVPLRLLPRLQKLVWSDHRKEAVSYLHCILSSDMICLELRSFTDANDLDEETTRQLSTISSSCPNVRFLTLGEVPLPLLSRMLIPEHARIGAGFSQLESLDASGRLPEDALSHLSTLVSLKRLKYLTHRVFSQVPIVHHFNFLRHLEVNLGSSRDAPYIFCEPIQLPNITTLSIVIRSTISQDEAYGVFNSISKFTTLTKLVIRVFLDAPLDDNATSTDTTACISPLLSLRHLHALHILLQDIRLDDNMIARLAGSLPDLREFSLLPTVPMQINLSGLRKLAELCPQLEELAAGIDFRSTCSVGLSPVANLSPTASRLWRLSVGGSPIHDAESVAATLRAWFPSLQKISEYSEKGSDEQAKWQRVKEIIATSRANDINVVHASGWEEHGGSVSWFQLVTEPPFDT
ncbi:hypothetical protein HGRIS_006216 [Hohenbuehelia grisea]|uniref:F-box domain-containing protein n=1 Tax=Hohenbuehelia grisea TaxID=104357 RepID=A0ABR3K065_9AGAR